MAKHSAGGGRPRHLGGLPMAWLNLAECFFSIITRQAIRRATFTSVRRKENRCTEQSKYGWR
jgi:hypothetical protein